MNKYFDDNLFLTNVTAGYLYDKVRYLPIIDFHSHLDSQAIYEDQPLNDIGRLWLEHDHYKWRIMRLNGVDEKYITGSVTYKEKFLAFAAVLEKAVASPVYYFAQMELKNIFNIQQPLTSETAEEIYNQANLVLSKHTIRSLLKMFNVDIVCTTDDPLSDLKYHGQFDGLKVLPTFRPDRLYDLNETYIKEMEILNGKPFDSLDDYLKFINQRLDFFISKGCVISDHGFINFPKVYATYEQASRIFINRHIAEQPQKDMFFGFILKCLMNEYKKRNLTMQIHFGPYRNVNNKMFERVGVDSGFDIMGDTEKVSSIVTFLNLYNDEERPNIILYPLNNTELSKYATLSGAFRNVNLGPAWWFNDSKEGIYHNLKVISEYASLGNNLGMLTDSRSFSSYVRFDFFRRILADFFGQLIEKGEYDLASAIKLMHHIAYKNSKMLMEG